MAIWVGYLLVQLVGSNNEAEHNELFLHHRIHFIYLPGHLRAGENVQNQLRNQVQKEQEVGSIFTAMRETEAVRGLEKNNFEKIETYNAAKGS